MSNKEKNTKLFYKELKNNPCNIELLYKLSSEGIFLYDLLYKYNNIKYHECVVDISIKNNQYFKIYNDNQYNRYINMIKEYKEKKDNQYLNFRLIIPNKYFISRLVNDKELHLSYTDLNTYYLLKYNYISNITFDYFKKEILSEHDVVSILFIDIIYLKNNFDITKITNYINNNYFYKTIFGVIGINVDGIEYIINNISNRHYDSYCYNYRINPCFPRDLLIKYSSKLYKPNILYFKYSDKYIEDIFNNLCSDNLLKELHYSKSFKYGSNFNLNLCLKKYNISQNIQNFEILNFEKYILNKPSIKTEQFNMNEEDLWFGNKTLFNFNFTLNNYENLSDNMYDYSYDEINMFSDIFIKEYLNDEELSKILKNPEYILYKYENDYSIEKNFFYFSVVKCCFVGSLIYNNYSKFIIYSLVNLIDCINLKYLPQDNRIYFDCKYYCEENYDWPCDYEVIISYTITTTSNDDFNYIFFP